MTAMTNVASVWHSPGGNEDELRQTKVSQAADDQLISWRDGR